MRLRTLCALACAAAACLAGPGGAAGDAAADAARRRAVPGTVSLRGLEALHLSIVVPERVGGAAVKGTAQAAAEKKLRAAGLLLLSQEEAKRLPGKPSLTFVLDTTSLSSNGEAQDALRIQTELRQEVALRRDPGVVISAPTFRARTYAPATTPLPAEGRSPVESAALLALDAAVDEFVWYHRAANTKP